MIRKYTSKLLLIGMFALMASAFASCDDGKSYSDLLNEEEAAVNWYLAQNRVETRIPADSVFEVGPDAPFYRMNSDGTVYMRVLNMGDMDNRPVEGQTVYMRYTLYDINTMHDNNSTDLTGSGNAETVISGPSSFVFGNGVLTTTTSKGMGLQVPLNYLGYNCEVDLIVKSTEGPTSAVSECQALLFKGLKYFKAEY